MKSAPAARSNESALDPRRDSSTATEAQRRRIVEMLRTGRKTTLDFRRAGIMQSQTRIFELRQRPGYDIPTVGRVTIADDHGFLHCNVAVYELRGEPDEVASTTPRPKKPKAEAPKPAARGSASSAGDPFGDLPGAGDLDWGAA